MAMDTVVVFADDRERDGSVVEALRRMPDLEVVVCRLERGDYAVGQSRSVVFERKTLRDFAQSVVDGRLFRQAHGLATTPSGSAFILEGRGSDLGDVHVRREALQGAMVTLTIIFEIPVLRSRDPEETARLLLYSANQLHRAQTEALPRPGKRPRSRRRLQLHILQGLPGVGPHRAGQLLDAFGSVSAVMNAAGERIRALPGFGEKTVERIDSILREERTPYGGPDCRRQTDSRRSGDDSPCECRLSRRRG